VIRYEINSFGALPISVATAKDYLKVETAADDNMITKLVDGVTVFAERHTGRELRINQWRAFDDDFPSSCWEIRRTPIATIDDIQYIVSGGSVIVADTIYELNRSDLYPIIRLSNDQSWPTDIDPNLTDAVLINFTTQADKRIDEIIMAMLRHIADVYENRGDSILMERLARGSNFYSNVRIPNF